MKRKLIILLTIFMMFSLLACGESEDDEKESKKSKKKDKTKTEEVDDKYEEELEDEDELESEEELEDEEETADASASEESVGEEESAVEETVQELVTEVTFDIQLQNEEEYAVLTGLTDRGEVVWSYETEHYQIAQLYTVGDIGLYNDMYYYVESGSVITINPQNGEQIWKNDDFRGSISGHDFDEKGTLYICGYFGPDLTAIDVEGNTVYRQEELNEDYYWPYKMTYEPGYIFITYEECSSWPWIMKNYWNGDEENIYGGYTLSYCLQDGSIDSEHNALEPEFAFQGNYRVKDGLGEMQIDYLGTGVYLINIRLGQQDLYNIIGEMQEGDICFEGVCDKDTYAGIVTKTENGLGVIITSTTNEAIAVNEMYVFGLATDEEPVEGELSSDELMARITDVSATSVLSEYGGTHSAELVIDDDINTGWVEGSSGQGINETLTITLDGEYMVKGFYIHAGYQKSDSLYEKNSRPKLIEVSFSNGEIEVFTLEDFCGVQNCELSKPAYISSISITIRSVYPGSKYEDTVISELKLY